MQQNITNIQIYTSVDEYVNYVGQCNEQSLMNEITQIISELQIKLNHQAEIIKQLKMRNCCLEEEMRQLDSNEMISQFHQSSVNKSQMNNTNLNQNKMTQSFTPSSTDNNNVINLNSNFLVNRNKNIPQEIPTEMIQIPIEKPNFKTKESNSQDGSKSNVSQQMRRSTSADMFIQEEVNIQSSTSPQQNKDSSKRKSWNIPTGDKQGVKNMNVLQSDVQKSPKPTQMYPVHRKSAGNSFNKDTFQDIIPPNQQQMTFTPIFKNISPSSQSNQMNQMNQINQPIQFNQMNQNNINLNINSNNIIVNTPKQNIKEEQQKKSFATKEKIEIQQLKEDNTTETFTIPLSGKKMSQKQRKEEPVQKITIPETSPRQQTSSPLSPGSRVLQTPHDKNKKVKVVNKNQVETDKKPETAPVISVESTSQGPLPSVFSLPLSSKKKTQKRSLVNAKGKEDE